jgi:DNA-binding CsgD family transcriptional regulator
VAIHLLATEPRGEESTAALLRDAARAASLRGAPESAIAYLRRARREGDAQRSSPGLLHELGAAEAWAGKPMAAIETLTEAMAIATDARGPALTALDLGRALITAGRFSDAAQVLHEAAAALPPDDRELALRVQAELIATARLDPGSQQLVRDQLALHSDLRGETPGERLLLASIAFDRVWRGATADEIAALAERALAGGRLVEEHSSDIPTLYEAVFALIACDRFEQAHRALDAALDDARRRGSTFAFFTASAFRCLANCWGGSLIAAEADGRLAVEAALTYGSPLAIVFSYLIDALIARDELDDAREVLESSGIGEEIPDDLVSNSLLYQRARLRLAQGEADAGLADLLEVGRRLERADSGALTAAFAHRSLAAEVLAARGEGDAARELAAEELRLARAFGGRRAISMALRGAGVVEGGDAGIELLREAVATLEPSGSPLERSRAMVDLGAALRRAGQRVEAREQLSIGLDVAHRWGAAAIERRAREELIAAGARPRRERVSGPEALTASELRVARMAVHGMANREIAEQLFVSLRTVETHLTHAYAKLEIKSRRELGDALRSREPGASQAGRADSGPPSAPGAP